MVQNSRSTVVIGGILLRVILLCLVAVTAIYTGTFFLDILEKYLGYKTPSGFFGFTLADTFVTLDLALVFWSGIFFGTLGKKIDYVVIFLFILSASWEYIGLETITPQMWVGLISTLIISNSIGFILKLARQKFLPNIKV